MEHERLDLGVTEVGEFIAYNSCERRLKLGLNGRAIAREVPFFGRTFNTIDLVLEEAGRKWEDDWEKTLNKAGLVDLTEYSSRGEDRTQTSWEELVERLSALEEGQPAFGREILIGADLGAFHLKGRMDFVLVLWKDGVPKLRVVECKASRRDRTSHRIQVALYRMMVHQYLESTCFRIQGHRILPEDVECVVARIDESTNEAYSILGLDPLDLEMEVADAERMLAPEGPIARIWRTNLDDLEFRLEPKCDGCVFDVHCFSESARQRRLELLGIEPSTARTLRNAGIATIDDLANLTPDDSRAAYVRTDQGFSENLDRLVINAKARRSTLPRGENDPDDFEVRALPNTGNGQLPTHDQSGQRLIRIYLSVDYDYVENRLGALAAHVTKSEGQIHTDFIRKDDGRWVPNPDVMERREVATENGQAQFEYGPVQGRDVIRFKTSQWTGRYGEDTGSERELIQTFLHDLVDAIAEVADAASAPIHFYVWSRSEMTRLVEACSRASSMLLGSLRELLGCRESLEQLIYSCLQEEVDRRFVLGWTGRGLAVVSSLSWYGRRYHWQRKVGNRLVDLDRAFTQGIFDFKTDIGLTEDGRWAKSSAATTTRHKFEIHSRFHDSLPAPYWRAVWRQLRDPNDPSLKTETADAIRRYNVAAGQFYLREFLRARVQALRWVEEGVRFKNSEIVKPPMVINELPDFSLNVDNTARAAIDFLRLDQHVKTTDWIARNLVPPANRVPLGQTIPVSEVVSHGNNRLSATIDLGQYDINLPKLATRTTLSEGAFVRLTPSFGDPGRGQTLGQLTRGGKTCRITGIDGESGQITLESMWTTPSRYTLKSAGDNEVGEVFDHATIEESISDFVAGRVDERLRSGFGAHAYEWFDPENPSIPKRETFSADTIERFSGLLQRMTLPNELPLALDQASACIDGLESTVQLLLGPPGTGKTTTTAVATLLRILAGRCNGDIVLIAAHTHTAVDTLLKRIDWLVTSFAEAVEAAGLTMPSVRLAKVHSSVVQEPSGGGIQDIIARPCAKVINQSRRDSVLVIGGTTGAVLKMADELSERKPFVDMPDRFQVPTLIVDEASMMVFPHFLALATLVSPTGEIMVAGDHRQLAPIVAHDWENEDRPPFVLYQPFASAYEAVRSISQNQEVSSNSVRRSALKFTFRLPPIIRELIARIYRLDDVELEGLSRDDRKIPSLNQGWNSVWQGSTGLYLVLHDERQSRQSNEVEAAIIERILDCGRDLPASSVAVVTPHRAQRSLLKMGPVGDHKSVDLIDTVERLQGGERPTVIVSATESDPAAIGARADFILDLNRANVAFSRAQDRLIVVCSDSLLGYVPAEIDQYESSVLWKSLRALCSRVVGTETVGDHRVTILTPPVEEPSEDTI
jgi:hypothetical protein